MSRENPIVLAVDDDKNDQEILKRVIERGVMRAVLKTVHSGEEALEYLKREGRYASPGAAPKPDLVLLDLNMPGLGGIETLAQIRSEESTSEIPVIVLTTSDDERDIFMSYKRGANSYITKPVQFENFVEVVRDLDEYWFDCVILPPKE